MRQAQLLLCSSHPGLPQGLALAGCPPSEAQRLSCCYSAGVPCPPGYLPSTALALRVLPGTGLWTPGLPRWLWLQPDFQESCPEWRCLGKGCGKLKPNACLHWCRALSSGWLRCPSLSWALGSLLGARLVEFV